jgi:hypothetical protein
VDELKEQVRELQDQNNEMMNDVIELENEIQNMNGDSNTHEDVLSKVNALREKSIAIRASYYMGDRG